MLKADMQVCAACSLARGIDFFYLYIIAGGIARDITLVGLNPNKVIEGHRLRFWWRYGRLVKDCVCERTALGALNVGNSPVDPGCPYLMQHLAAQAGKGE